MHMFFIKKKNVSKVKEILSSFFLLISIGVQPFGFLACKVPITNFCGSGPFSSSKVMWQGVTLELLTLIHG